MLSFTDVGAQITAFIANEFPVKGIIVFNFLNIRAKSPHSTTDATLHQFAYFRGFARARTNEGYEDRIGK